MALRDLYDETTGLLTERAGALVVDEVVVAEPWDVALRDVVEVLGAGSEARRGLVGHLRGLLSWFGQAWAGDLGREVWLRGAFASTVWPEVSDLDVVLHVGTAAAAGDEWVMQALGAQPLDLHPGRLTVTSLRQTGPSHNFERDQEARRSRVRVRDSHSGDSPRRVGCESTTRRCEGGECVDDA